MRNKKKDSVKKINSLTLKKLIFLRQKMSMAGGILDRFSRGAILFFYKAPRRNRHETPNIYFFSIFRRLVDFTSL